MCRVLGFTPIRNVKLVTEDFLKKGNNTVKTGGSYSCWDQRVFLNESGRFGDCVFFFFFQNIVLTLVWGREMTAMIVEGLHRAGEGVAEK